MCPSPRVLEKGIRPSIWPQVLLNKHVDQQVKVLSKESFFVICELYISTTPI